jgi:hypothetical protein
MHHQKSAAYAVLLVRVRHSRSFYRGSTWLTTGETGLAPRFKHSRVTAFRVNSHRYARILVSLLRVSSMKQDLT